MRFRARPGRFLPHLATRFSRLTVGLSGHSHPEKADRSSSWGSSGVVLGFVATGTAFVSLLLAPSCTQFVGCEKIRRCPASGGMGGEPPGSGGKKASGGEASGGEATGGEAGGGSGAGPGNGSGADGSGGAEGGSQPTACLPGEHVATTGMPLVCEPCPEGTFSTKKNQPSCSAWQDCEPGSYVALEGTASSDRECEPCAEETFSLGQNEAECAPWTVCEAGYIEDEPGSTTSDRSCSFQEWTRQFGTSAYDEANAVAVGAEGDIIVAGTTRGLLQGDGDGGDDDAFVRLYSPSGKAQWTRQFGTSTYDEANAVAADAAGNVIVTGWTDGVLQSGSAGGTDAFLQVYSPNGDTLWTRQFGTSEVDYGIAVAVDTARNIMVAGTTFGALDGQSAGWYDAFVRVYSPAGEVLWTRQLGTSGLDDASAVTVDATGNVIIAGTVGGALDGAGGGGGGENSAFVRVYSPSGEVQWTRQFGTLQGTGAAAVATDGAGNVIVAGGTGGALQGDGAGLGDAFVRVYSPSGDLLWTRQIGSSDYDYGRAVAVDGTGNITLVGTTSGALQGESVGSSDIFVRVFSREGDVLRTRQFGTSAEDEGLAVAVDAFGNLALAGWTGGVLQGEAAGAGDAFVLRLAAEPD